MGYHIILRPHPQSMTSEKELIDRLIERIDVSPDKSLRIRWTFRNEYGEEDTPCQPM